MNMKSNKYLYFEELQIRKDNGENLDFEKITYEELKKLSGDESYPDSLIAKLYNVSKSTVRDKRRSLGLTQYNMSSDKAIKDYIKKMRERSI
ncbi:hypothetical protein CLAUR_030700 [Clostridium felsineum]|nr:hypothetical protein CLAUR_030700 [Clostridium felsineum]